MACSRGWKILNLNRPQIDQNWIRKKIDEVVEGDDEAIAILTKHQELKTRLRTIKSFRFCRVVVSHWKHHNTFVNEINWYAKQC